MNRMTAPIRLLLPRLLLLLMMVTHVRAQAEGPKVEGFFPAHADFLNLIFFDPSDLYIQYLYKPSHQLDGQFPDAQVQYLYFEGAAGVGFGRDEALYADIQYTYKSFSFAESQNANVEDSSQSLQKLDSILAFSSFVNNDLLLAYVFYPGIDSDYSQHIGAKDMNWTTGPIAAYRLSPRFEFHGGVQLSQNYWETNVHPLVGMSYFSEDHKVHVNITAPFLYRIGYRTTSKSEVYASVWYYDNNIRMLLTPAGSAGGIDSRVKDREVLSGLGILLGLDAHWTLTLEAGLSVADALRVKEGATEGRSKSFEIAPYVSTALGFKF